MTDASLEYAGSITVNKKNYEVFVDEINGLVNLFYKSMKHGDVECFSLKRANVDKEKGLNLLMQTEKHWERIIGYSEKMLKFFDLQPFEQTFPMSFWDDILVPLKNGEQTNFNIGLL